MLGLAWATLALSTALQLPRHGVFGAVLSESARGAVVSRVVPQSAAADAHVSPGDVIIVVDSIRTPNVAAFLAQIHRLHAGQRAIISLLHNGAQRKTTVLLGAPANETDPAVTTDYGVVEVDGSLRRTLVTYPNTTSGKRPAVLLLGGIGCYTVDAAANPQDAYMRLTHDISRAGFVTMRLEKSGVGDSQGPPCRSVDFDAEERSYAAALTSLKSDPHVDSSRVFLFGHSIGSLEAPRLALKQHVAGVIVAEAVGRDWPEYEVRNLRRQLELLGTSPSDTDAALTEKQQCLVRLLYQREDEASIERSIPGCKTANGVYPVDARYMQQVAAVNAIDTWSKVNVPVLAIYGTSDFITEEADHRRIVAVVNAHHASNAVYNAIDGMDHYLFTAPSQKASLDLAGGAARTYDTQLSAVVVGWLRSKTRRSAMVRTP
jgi:alpha-beta hydrolase superfamily lysophospholipase